MKILTVTVPCYNSQDYMERCIDSLLPGGDRVEIIIIDDGSKDNTGAIADRYAQQYPNIVRVIHQENGGHGEGINQGVAHATGVYFKVVDSDDQLSEDFPAFLDQLEKCYRDEVDLVMTNYYYVHTDGKGDLSVHYKHPLKPGRVLTWEQTESFLLHQLITLHSGTFRTEHMRAWEEGLPKHVFYEDNLMVYKTLPHVRKLFYMDIDLYRYTIGREGQSVARDAMKKRYSHQMLVTEKCFFACHLDTVAEKKLKKYLKHELFMMFAFAICFARMNKDDASDAAVNAMWEKCIAFDEKWGKHFRYATPLWFLCLPGKFGRWLTNVVYGFCNSIIRYN